MLHLSTCIRLLSSRLQSSGEMDDEAQSSDLPRFAFKLKL